MNSEIQQIQILHCEFILHFFTTMEDNQLAHFRCLISTKLIPIKRWKVLTVMLKLVSYLPKNPKYHRKCCVLLENTPLQCEIHRNLHQGPKDPSLFFTVVCANCQLKMDGNRFICTNFTTRHLPFKFYCG